MSNDNRQANAQPSFSIETEYVRDMTLENADPVALLKISQGNVTPRLGIDVTAVPVQDTADHHHVILKTKLEYLANDKVHYVLEVEYVGHCVVSNVTDDMLPFILNVQCAHLLFPAVRHFILCATQNSGLPPINLQPINFLELLNSKQNQQTAQA